MNEAAILSRFPGLDNIRLLKKGGQKSVYSADSSEYGAVVLKLMKSGARIDREIAIVQRHGFSGVPRIFAVGDVEGDEEFSKFIIEQRIDGMDLKLRLAAQKGPLQTRFVIEMMRTILRTICELEDAHIVHRDIKPDNIVVDGAGRFWLLDFGIARDVDDVSLTRTDAQHGPCTPGYGAPEQVFNYKTQIDSRADLYSLGVTAYELLTGVNPFHRNVDNPIGAMVQSVTMDADTLEIGEDPSGQLAQFIKMLMNKNKTFRPPNARAALEVFETIVRGVC